jgi:hypothetical protein
MDNLILYKFVEEVRLQNRFAQFAFQNIRTSLTALDSERVFFYVHAFMRHAGNLSRLFWPARQDSSERGERLRSELKIGDQSPLRLQNFRRNLDQPDESLEDWVAALENRSYVDMNIMPQGTISNYKQDAFQRNLDPENFQYVFRGEACSLRTILDELRKLETTTESWIKTHRPW